MHLTSLLLSSPLLSSPLSYFLFSSPFFPSCLFLFPLFSSSLFLFSPLCSPGRTSGSFDNEIIMMNHVYKERFPKVSHPQVSGTLIMQLDISTQLSIATSNNSNNNKKVCVKQKKHGSHTALCMSICLCVCRWNDCFRMSVCFSAVCVNLAVCGL